MTKTKTKTKTTPPVSRTVRRYVGPFDTYCALAERDRRTLAKRNGR